MCITRVLVTPECPSALIQRRDCEGTVCSLMNTTRLCCLKILWIESLFFKAALIFNDGCFLQILNEIEPYDLEESTFLYIPGKIA